MSTGVKVYVGGRSIRGFSDRDPMSRKQRRRGLVSQTLSLNPTYSRSKSIQCLSLNILGIFYDLQWRRGRNSYGFTDGGAVPLELAERFFF